MKSQNLAVVTVARVNVRHAAKAAHDPRVYRHRQQSCLSLEQVNAAVQALSEIPQSRSLLYRLLPHTAAGPQDQPDYLNAAVVLETA
jgi:hypothetical protein